MVFEEMGDEDATFVEADGEKLRRLSVKDMQFASGMTQISDDEMIDIYIVEFTTINGDTHELVFQWSPAIELATMMNDWLNALHDAGNCHCGAHDNKEDDNGSSS